MAAIVTLTMNPALDIATSTERVEPTHKLRCTAPRYDAGGGGINVARAVHALGGEALAIFPAGGAAGEMIRHLLDEEGVAYDAVAIAGFTRESLAVEERASGNQFRFILPGPEISTQISSAASTGFGRGAASGLHRCQRQPAARRSRRFLRARRGRSRNRSANGWCSTPPAPR